METTAPAQHWQRTMADGRPKVVILCGPTASGKTQLSLELAQRWGGEVVNADSTQIYAGLDVGTDKIAPEDRQGIPHHLLDLVTPEETFTAADYARIARNILHDLTERGKLPLVVGGTGFYMRALTEGLFAQPELKPKIRAKLRSQAQTTEGLAVLYERLCKDDPTSAHRISCNDKFRIVRALEVLDSTGRTISWHWKEHARKVANSSLDKEPDLKTRLLMACERTDLPAPYEFLKVGVERPRAELYEAINQRAHHQMTDGYLEREVKALLEQYPKESYIFKTLTYRHMIYYMGGIWGQEQAIEELRKDTRRYAKRQLTWFRGDPKVEWFTLPAQKARLHQRISQFLVSP